MSEIWWLPSGLEKHRLCGQILFIVRNDIKCHDVIDFVQSAWIAYINIM